MDGIESAGSLLDADQGWGNKHQKEDTNWDNENDPRKRLSKKT
jgi:hypothetical protein